MHADGWRRYEDAAMLRDLVQKVQQKMDEAVARRDSSAQPTQPLRMKLGQRVEHADTGHKGIVYGWVHVSCACARACLHLLLQALLRGKGLQK